MLSMSLFFSVIYSFGAVRQASALLGRDSEGVDSISMEELQMMLLLSSREMQPIRQAGHKFPMRIPRYYAALMARHAVLRPVVVPSAKELSAALAVLPCSPPKTHKRSTITAMHRTEIAISG